jgi:phosphoglycolate phosphatase
LPPLYREMMKKRSVYLDLDGPILDVSEKYYRVHGAILGNMGCPSLNKDEFWSMKRRQATDLLAGSCPQLNDKAYAKAWLDRIETREFLAFDAIVPGAVEVLGQLMKEYHLFLVTLRQNPALLRWELETLGLSHFFVKVLSAHSATTPGWQVKADLIREAGLDARGGLAIIGDTEVDILAGKALGLTTIAVTNGIRARQLLEAVEPDFIIPDITGLPPLVEATRARRDRSAS